MNLSHYAFSINKILAASLIKVINEFRIKVNVIKNLLPLRNNILWSTQ